MAANSTAPSPPGLIDQLRDLIAKVFGWPRPRPHDTGPVRTAAADNPAAGRPGETT